MEGRGRTWKLSAPQTHVKDFWETSVRSYEGQWELFSPPLVGWKAGGQLRSFPRCRPAARLGSALRGSSLPRAGGQAAQKQMKSDTGAKEYSPEPLGGHITKCSDPEVTLFPWAPFMYHWHGKREACENGLNERVYFFFFLEDISEWRG